MIFYSLVFLLFFIAASICVQTAPDLRRQHRFFLAANIVFYGYWDVRFLILLFAVIAVCYITALRYQDSRKRGWIYTAVIICIAVLAVCKYTNFFIETFAAAFHIQNYETLNIILPLGISFYLFQAMSYVFDVKRETIPAEKSFLKLAVYISFFPQVTSGPIVKAHDFLPQLERLHRIKKANFYRGIQLFLLGLTKKVVFADRIGIAVDAVYAAPAAYDSVSIVFALIGYSLQIYCDFSGYSDMAAGIAAIWDFDLGANFNAPYIARNLSEFWRRWHISLSSWFRDYVYIPLGGSRRGNIRTYFNLFVTMLLSGFWHGASMTFVIWGAMHGLGSAVNRFWRNTSFAPRRREKASALSVAVCILANNIFIALTWIVFRAESIQQAWEIFSGLFRFNGITYVNIYVVCYAVLIGLFHAAALYKNGGTKLYPLSRTFLIL